MSSRFSPLEEGQERRSGAEDEVGRDCREDWVEDVVVPQEDRRIDE